MPSASKQTGNLLAVLQIASTTIGAGLLVAGLVWPFLVSPRTHWSDQQAEEYAEASAAFHSAAHNHPEEGSDADHQSEYQAVRQRYNTIRQQLDQARAQPRQIGFRLLFVGAILTTIGAVSILLRRD